MAKIVLTPKVLEALKSGNKIEAIKLIRAATSVGLAEAKSLVDEIEKAAPSAAKSVRAAPMSVGAIRHAPAPLRGRPGLGPGQMPSTGGPGKWLVLVAVAAIAIVVGLYY